MFQMLSSAFESLKGQMYLAVLSNISLVALHIFCFFVKLYL